MVIRSIIHGRKTIRNYIVIGVIDGMDVLRLNSFRFIVGSIRW